MDFSFLNDIVQALLKFVPRPIIVRLTHGGVRWRLGKYAKELKPGFHIIWPLITDYEVIVTARQTHHLATQSLVTKDGKQIAVGTLIVYSIRDVMAAIAERNWDTDSVVNDISLAVVVDEITKLNYNDLHLEIADRVAQELTQKCRKQLRQYGVYVHRVRLTEIAPVRTLKILVFEKMYSATNPSHLAT